MMDHLKSSSALYYPAHGGYPGEVVTDSPKFVKALIVTPDGREEYRDIEPSLEVLTELVGGPIEFVFVTNGVHAYVNEEGKLWGLPPNEVATRKAGYFPFDIFAGTAVFLGDGEDGEEGDLPSEWL